MTIFPSTISLEMYFLSYEGARAQVAAPAVAEAAQLQILETVFQGSFTAWWNVASFLV